MKLEGGPSTVHILQSQLENVPRIIESPLIDRRRVRQQSLVGLHDFVMKGPELGGVAEVRSVA
jgi:hypothetical protein